MNFTLTICKFDCQFSLLKLLFLQDCDKYISWALLMPTSGNPDSLLKYRCVHTNCKRFGNIKFVHFKKTVAWSSFLKLLYLWLYWKVPQFGKKWGLHKCLLKMSGLYKIDREVKRLHNFPLEAHEPLNLNVWVIFTFERSYTAPTAGVF